MRPPSPSRRHSSRFQIAVDRRHRVVALTPLQIRRALRTILSLEEVSCADLSVAIVDDATIHKINREHLDHDEPTDVISFLYSDPPEPDASAAGAKRPGIPRGRERLIDGELIVSAETAVREASRRDWDPRSELLLYLAHGLLHLCGYDDLSSVERRVMRARERDALEALGIHEIPR